MAIIVGGVAGMMCFVGITLLVHRRLFDARIRKTSSFGDIAILLMLYAQLILGLSTIAVSLQHLDGHEMVKFMTWAQGILTLQPGVSALVADVSPIFKLHLFLGMTIFLVFPFTRLVHVWSAPVWYLGRRGYQVVRTTRNGSRPPGGQAQFPRSDGNDVLGASSDFAQGPRRPGQRGGDPTRSDFPRSPAPSVAHAGRGLESRCTGTGGTRIVAPGGTSTEILAIRWPMVRVAVKPRTKLPFAPLLPRKFKRRQPTPRPAGAITSRTESDFVHLTSTKLRIFCLPPARSMRRVTRRRVLPRKQRSLSCVSIRCSSLPWRRRTRRARQLHRAATSVRLRPVRQRRNSNTPCSRLNQVRSVRSWSLRVTVFILSGLTASMKAARCRSNSWRIGSPNTCMIAWNSVRSLNILRGLPAQPVLRAWISPALKPCGSIKGGGPVIGDIIASFQDEAVINETLFSLGDLALTARLVALAAESNVSTGELAMQSVGRFVNGASDEEWLALFGQMSRSDNPGQVFLRRALANAASGLANR